MIDVVVVDDEPAGRRILREYCAAEADLRVVGEFGEGAAALAAIRLRRPQLVFLDVQMSPLSGIDVARALDGDDLPAIVFVTAYDRYALEAFDLSAVDYLLKPFDQDRFRRMLARVRRRARGAADGERRAALGALGVQLQRGAAPAADDRPRLVAESGGRLRVVDATRVEAIEADRNYVSIRIGGETLHARSTLQQAEQALGSQPMLRISRSCLVNVNHVREVNRTYRGDFIFLLCGGATLTSSEGFRGKVKEYLNSLRLGAS